MPIKDTTIRVRYAETDQMAVVYHSNYIIWFEIGRTEWFRQLDFNYKALEEKNILLPVIEVNCKYKRSALYDEEITIRTYLKKVKGVRLTFHYQILSSEEILLAEGETTHAFVDRDQKPVRMNRLHPSLWEILTNSVK